MRRLTRALLLAATASVTLLFVAAPAARADQTLIDATPSTVTVAVPAPGHSQEWTMSVRNVSGRVASLSLAVSGSDSALFAGTSPLTVTVLDDQGTVIPTTPAGQLVGSSLSLQDLEAGQTYTLRGSVALPRSADNSYQALGGRLTFSFVAMAASPGGSGGSEPPTPPDGSEPPDHLAYTGAAVAGAAALAIALLVAGSFLVATRGRKS